MSFYEPAKIHPFRQWHWAKMLQVCNKPQLPRKEANQGRSRSIVVSLPTCVLVSCALLPPGWRHIAAGTSGSPPSCGKWSQRGTRQWTCSPPGTRTAPWTRRRTVWRCCWTSWDRREGHRGSLSVLCGHKDDSQRDDSLSKPFTLVSYCKPSISILMLFVARKGYFISCEKNK